MKQKTILILAVATLAVGGAAALKLSHDESSVAPVAARETLLPSLLASVNDAASVTLTRHGASFTLVRTESGWGLSEKSSYPADASAVRQMLLALADLKPLEAKTDNPERYAKLGLQDPETEGSTATLVTIKDKAGKELAKVLIGKQSEGKGGLPSGNTYVRLGGEKQCWLAKGDPALKEKDVDWLDKKILEVKRDRVRSVDVSHADGEHVHVERAKPEDQNFELSNIPEGQELSYPSAPGSIAGALEYLNLEDVLPADKVDFSKDAGATSEFRTFDGLKVTVQVKEDGDKCYARFSAAYDAPPAIGPTPPPAPAEGDKQDAADPAKKDEPKKDESTRKPEEVQKEAAELQKRLAPWVYVVPSYNKASFNKRAKDLLKPKAPPPPPPGATPPGGASSDTYKIPDNLPPEIQEQIKADLEKKGKKTEIVPGKPPIDEDAQPAGGETKPAGEPPHDASKPAGEEKPAPTPPAPQGTPPHEA